MEQADLASSSIRAVIEEASTRRDPRLPACAPLERGAGGSGRLQQRRGGPQAAEKAAQGARAELWALPRRACVRCGALADGSSRARTRDAHTIFADLGAVKGEVAVPPGSFLLLPPGSFLIFKGWADQHSGAGCTDAQMHKQEWHGRLHFASRPFRVWFPVEIDGLLHPRCRTQICASVSSRP